jgi:SAM-dependent methyltransferase
MSYTLYTFRDQDQRDLDMWNNRDIETEVRVIQTREIVPVIEKYIDPSFKLIEAGCGLGGWVSYFSKKGYNITGIEYDMRIVEQAKVLDPDIKIICSNVVKLESDDNSFDGYISLGVIEHFEGGPLEALSEAKRVLKPAGLILLSVPLLTPLRRILAHPLRDLYFMIHKLRGGKKYFGEYRYTKKELLTFLKTAHFEIIYTGPDDYMKTDRKHHIGLYADYPILRKNRGEIWELNFAGKSVLRLLRIFSPWFSCGGIFVVARNMKEQG